MPAPLTFAVSSTTTLLKAAAAPLLRFCKLVARSFFAAVFIADTVADRSSNSLVISGVLGRRRGERVESVRLERERERQCVES